jgi:peptidoglycan-associated lipoprotein
MKQGILALLGLALLSTVACTKKIVEKAPPPPTPTQAAAAPTQQPPLQQRNTTPTPQAQPQAATNRPATISAKELASLNQSLARLEDALFDYDKSTIRQDATTALRDDVNVIREILAAYPSQKLLIEGHCDERGSDEYNVALGDRRAKAAEEFLVTMGVPNVQLTMISYGKQKPVCTDETEACWQKNRRAHLTAAR